VGVVGGGCGVMAPTLPAPNSTAACCCSQSRSLLLLQVQEGLDSELSASLDRTEAAVRTCDASGEAPLVLYVSKMVAVPAAALPRCVAGWLWLGGWSHQSVRQGDASTGSYIMACLAGR